jgi:hypothetical protein
VFVFPLTRVRHLFFQWCSFFLLFLTIYIKKKKRYGATLCTALAVLPSCLSLSPFLAFFSIFGSRAEGWSAQDEGATPVAATEALVFELFFLLVLSYFLLRVSALERWLYSHVLDFATLHYLRLTKKCSFDVLPEQRNVTSSLLRVSVSNSFLSFFAVFRSHVRGRNTTVTLHTKKKCFCFVACVSFFFLRFVYCDQPSTQSECKGREEKEQL